MTKQTNETLPNRPFFTSIPPSSIFSIEPQELPPGTLFYGFYDSLYGKVYAVLKILISENFFIYGRLHDPVLLWEYPDPWKIRNFNRALGCYIDRRFN